MRHGIQKAQVTHESEFPEVEEREMRLLQSRWKTRRPATCSRLVTKPTLRQSCSKTTENQEREEFTQNLLGLISASFLDAPVSFPGHTSYPGCGPFPQAAHFPHCTVTQHRTQDSQLHRPALQGCPEGTLPVGATSSLRLKRSLGSWDTSASNRFHIDGNSMDASSHVKM